VKKRLLPLDLKSPDIRTDNIRHFTGPKQNLSDMSDGPTHFAKTAMEISNIFKIPLSIRVFEVLLYIISGL
jgi:hypothetical protein